MSGLARLGVVTVLLAAGVAAGQATAGPAPAAPAPQPVPVAGATAVCPDVLQDGDRGATAVTAGGATTRHAGGLGAAQAALGGAPVVRDLAGAVRGPFVVTATGPTAGALAVEQVTRATGGRRRGVAAVTCPAPGTSSWFVGGATVVGTTSELMLVNLEDVAASVDVRVWTAEGPADSRPGRGVAVPPRSRVVVPIERLAPDHDLLAVHVAAIRGRVASSLRVARSDGRTPLGVDWVPPAQPPAVEVVVPGLPQGPGRRTALLTNPGDVDALASLELTTADGQLVPAGLEDVLVPAGTSVAVDLTAALAQTPAAVRVRTDGVPIVAGAVLVDGRRGPVRDLAFSAGSAPVTSPALLADVRLSRGTEVTLLLSAVSGDAAVDLVPVAAPGALPSPQRVGVPAGTTVAVALSRFVGTGSLALEVRPVLGAVHAARYSREEGARGPLTALLPLTPGRLVVPRLAVVADPGAGR